MNKRSSSTTEVPSKLAPRDRLRCIFSSSTKMKLPRVKWRYAVAAILLIVLGSAGTAFWRAQRALRTARIEVQSQANLQFSVRKVVPVNGSFEWLGAPESFAGAVLFKGDFYLGGASGLFRYDSHGVLTKHYRP